MVTAPPPFGAIPPVAPGRQGLAVPLVAVLTCALAGGVLARDSARPASPCELRPGALVGSPYLSGRQRERGPGQHGTEHGAAAAEPTADGEAAAPPEQASAGVAVPAPPECRPGERAASRRATQRDAVGAWVKSARAPRGPPHV